MIIIFHVIKPSDFAFKSCKNDLNEIKAGFKPLIHVTELISSKLGRFPKLA